MRFNSDDASLTVFSHLKFVWLSSPFENKNVVLHDACQSPRITMFDYECVPEPLCVGLNVVVDPFLSPKCQGTERVQRPDVVDENVRRDCVRRDWFLLW